MGVKKLIVNLAGITKKAQDISPEVAYALAEVLDEKAGYTSEDSKRLSQQAVLIAKKMRLDIEEIDRIRTAALLRDIGKFDLPTYILDKPKPLTDREKKIVREHSRASKKILGRVKGFESVVPIVRAIHERWDGKGYPDGLAREAIPIGARIIAVVDTYWALCSDRSRGKKLDQEEAIENIKNQAGSQLDPKVVEVFLCLVSAKDLGANVEE